MNTPRYNRKNKKLAWSRDMDLKLLKVAGTKPVDEIAKEFGKSVNAITKRCFHIGVSYKYNG